MTLCGEKATCVPGSGLCCILGCSQELSSHTAFLFGVFFEGDTNLLLVKIVNCENFHRVFCFCAAQLFQQSYNRPPSFLFFFFSKTCRWHHTGNMCICFSKHNEALDVFPSLLSINCVVWPLHKPLPSEEKRLDLWVCGLQPSSVISQSQKAHFPFQLHFKVFESPPCACFWATLPPRPHSLTLRARNALKALFSLHIAIV